MLYNVVVNKCGKNLEVWKRLIFSNGVDKAWYRVGRFNEHAKEGVIIRKFNRSKNYKSLKGFIEGIESEYGKGNWDTPFTYDWKDVDDMQQFLNKTLKPKGQRYKQTS